MIVLITILVVALVCFVWTAGFFLGKSLAQRPEKQIIYVPQPVPVREPTTRYVNDYEGNTYQIERVEIARRLDGIQRRLIEDVHGDHVEIIYYGQKERGPR